MNTIHKIIIFISFIYAVLFVFAPFVFLIKGKTHEKHTINWNKIMIEQNYQPVEILYKNIKPKHKKEKDY